MNDLFLVQPPPFNKIRQNIRKTRLFTDSLIRQFAIPPSTPSASAVAAKPWLPVTCGEKIPQTVGGSAGKVTKEKFGVRQIRHNPPKRQSGLNKPPGLLLRYRYLPISPCPPRCRRNSCPRAMLLCRSIPARPGSDVAHRACLLDSRERNRIGLLITCAVLIPVELHTNN